MNIPNGDRLALLAWGWTMLLVVLLSAAPTGGAPRTQLIGSAFDPATVSVALKTRQVRQDTATVAQKKDADDPVGTPTPLVAAVEPAFAMLGLPAPVSGHGPGALDPPKPNPFARAHPPRAPPTA